MYLHHGEVELQSPPGIPLSVQLLQRSVPVRRVQHPQTFGEDNPHIPSSRLWPERHNRHANGISQVPRPSPTRSVMERSRSRALVGFCYLEKPAVDGSEQIHSPLPVNGAGPRPVIPGTFISRASLNPAECQDYPSRTVEVQDLSHKLRLVCSDLTNPSNENVGSKFKTTYWTGSKRGTIPAINKRGATPTISNQAKRPATVSHLALSGYKTLPTV